MQFITRHPQYEYLRKKWIAKNTDASAKFLEKHGDSIRHLTLGGLGGLVLLTNPGVQTAVPHDSSLAGGGTNQGISKGEDKNTLLLEAIKPLVPSEVRKLDAEEENQLTKIISEKLGINVKAELEGIRLNKSYGLIGGEQHLYRYPGDNLYKHADHASDWAMYGPAGIAPGLGAWGYFAQSEQAFNDTAKLNERYYLAVQTFLSPGFAENFARYRDFYKFRKMVVVNTKTGQACVAVIGDAGPAEWTGKSLGGSPEVMEAVGLAKGPRKGAVLYFFVDDPNNSVPLGPITVRNY